MPRRHIETRNIVFHKVDIPNGSLCMMKTEISTNGEAPIEAREHRRATITQDHKRTGSAHLGEPGNRSGEEKKRSLFRRPGVIVAAAALAIAGIGYGGIVMFHSFTHETTDDAFVDVHTVSVAPKVAGHVAVVRVDDNQLVKKGDVLIEIDPRDFQVAVGQALMSLVPPRIWVIANFKETQLRNMQPGQPLDISVDAYPSLKLRGHVDSIQAGSGAAFTLLPPENATGNYVKVVQRVPVKIVLDDQQNLQRVLGPGMSVVPTVYVGGEVGAAWKVAIGAIILAAGVILGAALWIGRVQKGQG